MNFGSSRIPGAMTACAAEAACRVLEQLQWPEPQLHARTMDRVNIKRPISPFKWTMLVSQFKSWLVVEPAAHRARSNVNGSRKLTGP